MVTKAMPGSCGELVQGEFDGHNVHITWPVKRFSIATARALERPGIIIAEERTKTAEAVEKALVRMGAGARAGAGTGAGVGVEIESALPQGKGMASSTADIGAALYAVFELFGRTISDEVAAGIALEVEPTDGTLFDGIVAFDHIAGTFFERLGDAPPIDVIVLEPHAVIDTVAFNQTKPHRGRADELMVRESYELAVAGIASADISMLGKAATLSALANQVVLYKPELLDVVETTRRRGALGVNVAHSGTVMGVMVERGFAVRLLENVSHYVPRGWDAYVVEVIGGGVRPVDDDVVQAMVGLNAAIEVRR